MFPRSTNLGSAWARRALWGALVLLLPQRLNPHPVPGAVWPWGSGGWGRCPVSHRDGLGTSVFEAATKVMVLSCWKGFPKPFELLHVSCAPWKHRQCVRVPFFSEALSPGKPMFKPITG